MAVTRTSTGALVSSAAALTATFGVGATAGDLGILIVESANQTVATPSGWTNTDGFGVGSAGLAGGTACWIFAKASITSGDISSGIAVADSGDHQNAVLLTFTGYDATTPYVDTFFGSDSSTVTTTPNINGATGRSTTVNANDLALAIICTDRDSATVSTNSGATWSNIAGSNSFIVNVSSATAAGGGIIVNQLTPSGTQTAGATFNCTITASAWAGVVLVIKAPVSGITLTGQSVSVAQGSVVASVTFALTGQSLVVAQGSVGIGAALSGQSLSVSQGSVTQSRSVALTSQATTVGQGSVVASPAFALSGQSIVVTQGSVTQSSAAVLTGQSATIARGSVLAANTETLSGQTLTAAQGSLSPSASLALTGQSSSVAQGSVTQSRSISLSGLGTSLAQGTTSPAISVTISGQSLVVGQGTISVAAASSVTAALTGLSLSAAQGSVAGSITASLFGQSASLSQGLITQVLSLALSGEGLTGSLGSIAGSQVLPTSPFVPPTISLGFRRQRPTNAAWGNTDQSGAAWKPDPDTTNDWSNSGGQSGTNWKKKS